MKGLNKMRWTKRIEWLPLIAAMLMIGVAAMAAKVGNVEFINDSGAYDGVAYLDRSGNYIWSSVNVGFGGITAPATSIETGGIIRISRTLPALQFRDTDATYSTDIGVIETPSNAMRFGLYDASEVNTYYWMLSTYDNAGAFVTALTARVAIGTTSVTAGYQAEVNGAIKVTGNASIAGRIYYGKLATAPASPAEGDQFYNSTTHKLQVYDGSTWQNCW